MTYLCLALLALCGFGSSSSGSSSDTVIGYTFQELMGSGEGNLIETLDVSGVSQCVDRCDALETCVAFTYFFDRGQCKLKSAIGIQTVQDDRNTYVKQIPESPTSAGTFRFRGNAYCLDADGKLFESINTAGPHVDTSEKCLAVLSEYFGSNPFFIGMSQYSKYCSGHFVGGKVGQTEDLTIPNLPLLVDNLNKRTAWGGYQWYYHIRNGDSLSTEMSSPSTFGEDTSATVPNAAVQRCYDYTVQPASETVSPTMVPTQSPTMEPTLNPSLSPEYLEYNLGTGYYCEGHPGGWHANEYQTINACEQRCTDLGLDCVAYSFVVHNGQALCVTAAWCDIDPNEHSGTPWRTFEKILPPPEDCNGVVNGDAVEDICGVCMGDGTSCVVTYDNLGSGKYCASHPGGWNVGKYQMRSECEQACTDLGPDCVAYTWLAADKYCVLAHTCEVHEGGNWALFEKRRVPSDLVVFRGGNADLSGAYFIDGTRDGKPLYKASNGARIEYWSHSSQGSAWWWVDSSGEYVWSSPFKEDVSSITPYQWTSFHGYGVAPAPSFKEYDLVAYRGGNSDVNFGYVIDGTRDGKPVYKASNGAKIEYWSHSSQGSAWWWVDASGEYIWSAPYREDISSIIPNQWTSYHGFGVVPAPSFNEHELNAYRGGNIDLNVGYNVDGQRDGKPLYKASNGARIEYWATSHFLGSTSAWWWVNSAGQYVWYAPSTGDISIITPNQWTSYEGKGVGIAPSFHPNLYVAFGAGNNDLNGAYIPNGLRDGKPLYQASNGAKIEYWSHSSQGSAWWWVDSSGNYCWSTPFTEDLSSIVSEQWTPYHHFGVGAAPSFYGSNYAEQPISGRRMLMGSEANALIKSSAQARKH